MNNEITPYMPATPSIPGYHTAVAKVDELELHDGEIDAELANAILDWIESWWLTNGNIPSSEQARDVGGLPYDKYEYYVTQRSFRKLLAARGVRIRTGDPEIDGTVGGGNGLTSTQLAAANIVSDLHDNRSIKRKLSDLEVSTQVWQAWMHDPTFVAYLNAKTEAEIFAYQYESHLALLDEVRSGNLAAIKYYNELTGRFVQNKDKGGSFDPVKIIRDITEILLEETKEVVQHDKDLLPRIGLRLNGLIANLLAEATIRNS